MSNAVVPTPTGPATVTFGVDVYPLPSFVIFKLTTPLPEVTKLHVAIAPLPLPSRILILGAIVYPEPGLVRINSLIENTPALSVVIAIADAFVPPAALLVLIETIGVPVYPLPSFKRDIELI